MRSGRIIAVLAGALLAVIGAGLALAGLAIVIAHTALREDGFYLTPAERFETTTAVLTARSELGTAGWSPDRPVGTVRVEATAADQGPIFVGIGPRDEVDAWLAGTAHERVDSVRYLPFRADTERVPGAEEVTPPGAQGFWAVSAAGPGTQTVTWPSEQGRWTLVVMNADAEPGVAADVAVGVASAALLPAGIVVGVIGLVLFAAGLTIMLVAVAGTRIEPVAGTVHRDAAVAPPAGDPPAYPVVRVDARLDEPLSRWLWLVKWFLAIPHLFLLALLWLAFWLLTIVAGVMILVTGRYPRPVFDFNVGVLRWSWRVMYYAFRVLGTDRYPPFRLEPDPTYPADLAVDYPQRLSRGLVLVKWWLLAIPHYLVVGILVGGGAGWFRWSGWGLIGVLALIAVVILAFTGRYPPALFDLLLGLNRWTLRVVAYAALMRDEYPPFRLDSGGVDPGTRAAVTGPDGATRGTPAPPPTPEP